MSSTTTPIDELSQLRESISANRTLKNPLLFQEHSTEVIRHLSPERPTHILVQKYGDDAALLLGEAAKGIPQNSDLKSTDKDVQDRAKNEVYYGMLDLLKKYGETEEEHMMTTPERFKRLVALERRDLLRISVRDAYTPILSSTGRTPKYEDFFPGLDESAAKTQATKLFSPLSTSEITTFSRAGFNREDVVGEDPNSFFDAFYTAAYINNLYPTGSDEQNNRRDEFLRSLNIEPESFPYFERGKQTPEQLMGVAQKIKELA